MYITKSANGNRSHLMTCDCKSLALWFTPPRKALCFREHIKFYVCFLIHNR